MLGIAPARWLEDQYRGYTIRRYWNDFGQPCWYILGLEDQCGPEGFSSVYRARYAIDMLEDAA